MKSWIIVFLLGILFVLHSGPVSAQDRSVNLHLSVRSGWSHPVVPAPCIGSTPTSCWLNNWLGNPIWLNAHGENTGNEATPGGFDVTFYVDGDFQAMGYAPPTSGEFTVLDLGPQDLGLSGRHTLSAYVDAFHAINETDEDDNTWGGQFLWPGRTLFSIPTVYPAPPPREAGWEHCPDTSVLKNNCDGYTFSCGGSGWTGVTVRPLGTASQYTLRLYEYNDDDSQDGYSDALDASGGLPGDLVGLVVHESNPLHPQTYNLGVENVQGGADYRISAHQPQTLIPGTPFTQEFGPDQDFALWTFQVPADQFGDWDLILRTDSGHPLRLGCLEQDFTYGDIQHQPVAGLGTNQWGVAYLCRTFSDTQERVLTAYLDTSEIVDPFTFTVEVSAPRANLYPSVNWLYWDYPVTPSNTAQNGTAHLGTVLHGDSTTTYLNYLVRNDTNTDTPNFLDRLALDGVSFPLILHFGGMDGPSIYAYNRSTPITVTGGRHTLSLKTDTGSSVSEIDERDNAYAKQYCWLPSPLPYGNVQTMPAPPAKTGGHSYALPGTELRDNCSALRLAVFDPTGGESNWWRGMAAMPVAGNDVDAHLHHAYTTSTTSFDDPLVSSEESDDDLDFVLVNMREQPDPAVPFEAGFTLEAGADGFTAQAVSSSFLGHIPRGSYGPWTMLSEDLLHVHEVYLEGGSVAIKLDNVSGEGTLGVTFIRAGVDFVSRTTPDSFVSQRTAKTPGGDVWMNPMTIVDGYYAIAVWKKEAADLDTEISYQLRLYPQLSDTAELPVADTGLVSVAPNPFNPRTTLAFYLSAPDHVRLAIHDLRGTLVRVLCEERLPAGRHEAVWTGKDENGRAVGSGVYLARFSCGQVMQTQRLTLIR